LMATEDKLTVPKLPRSDRKQRPQLWRLWLKSNQNANRCPHARIGGVHLDQTGTRFSLCLSRT
jgi:hypothetical protein